MPVGNLQGPVLPFSLLEPLIGRPKIKTPTRRLYQEVGSCEQRVKRRSDHMTYCLKEAKPQSESIGAEDWMTAAFNSDENEVDEEALNEVCNLAVKAMLDEDEVKLADAREELDHIGLFYNERGNKDGALFISSLIKLTEHEICDEVELLEGKHKDAFLKIFGLVEDSGWNLSEEGENEENDNIS